ncbi:MAG: circularly permuted type 2 ATP-grasp protein [Sulfurimonas sp.]|nr:circularly permuted type 2 ATP-grasp protein [Sulfurimonas sp.]
MLKASHDEMFDENKNIKKHWQEIADSLESSGFDELESKQNEIDWFLKENDVTYNVYENLDAKVNRSWSLDPIPFVISSQEWDETAIGLKQRAKLLNLILKDLYSERKLIKENIIPAEVIFAHKGFATEAFDFGSKENFQLYFYAADMARGPNGKMWVVNDRAQAPSGLGYALENRLTMNAISKGLYPETPRKRLFHFFEDFRNLFQNLSSEQESVSVLLTPGPYNETYFEHAFLSSYLNLTLAQGDDLLVKNDALWLKSLGGLKKVQTLLRRVDDRYCDPLELNDSSRLGVSGLLDAARVGNVNLINPIGSAILENIGLNPFMEKACEYLLGEKLILPQIATWWCGQEKALKFVLKNLETLIVKNIDRTVTVEAFFCKKMREEELENLREKIIKNPYQYVAQEEINFSTIPFYADKKIEPRNASIRAFSIKVGDDYSVMNGGLVRVSATKDSLLVSSQKGGTSKDLWILGKDDLEMCILSSFKYSKYVDTSIENLSTLKAENLFWLGRYLARSITTTRFVLQIVKKLASFYRFDMQSTKESQEILHTALTHLTMTYPGFLSLKEHSSEAIMDEILSVIKDTSRPGTLTYTLFMLLNANLNLKDILAMESWKLHDKMKNEWFEFLNSEKKSNIYIAGKLENTLIYLMAYKELVQESIFKEQGLLLYEIGSKIEDTILLLSLCRSLMTLDIDKSMEYDILDSLLHTMESFNAYRAHYKSSLMLENVVEFVVLNRQFPKSIIHICKELIDDFKILPKSKEIVSDYEEPIYKAYKILESMEISKVLRLKEDEVVFFEFDRLLAELSQLYIDCSNEFTKTYFSHNDE